MFLAMTCHFSEHGSYSSIDILNLFAPPITYIFPPIRAAENLLRTSSVGAQALAMPVTMSMHRLKPDPIRYKQLPMVIVEACDMLFMESRMGGKGKAEKWKEVGVQEEERMQFVVARRVRSEETERNMSFLWLEIQYNGQHRQEAKSGKCRRI